MTETEQLLRSYADSGSEIAFREFVGRYIDLVYSTALRKLGEDSHLAEDVTQAVFADLARKVRGGDSIQMPGGWLHQHTCFLAAKAARTESRRRVHETEAAQMNLHDSEPGWRELAPVLDDAMSALEPSDRHAIVLRFFEKRDFHAVGDALGISDDAAQKRVSRAVDKLRTLLASRGVALSATLLATLLAEKAVHAAPMGLAPKVVLSVLTSVPVAGLLTSILGKLMTAKVMLLVGTVALITAIAIPVAYKAHRVAAPVAPEAVKQTTGPTTQTAGPKQPASPAAAASAPVVLAGNGLHLTVLDAETEKPLRDVEIMNWTHLEATTDAKGQCDVPIRLVGNQFKIFTVKEPFADISLLWIPEEGDVIPSNYTVRLKRATPIGGQVVDPDGQPVAGATVSFRTSNRRRERESQNYTIRATSDQNGHWEVNRFAGEVLAALGGVAMHPDHVSSGRFEGSNREDLQQLKEQKYVFRMGRSGVVRGRVIDSDGKPIPGAEVVVGPYGESNSRTTNALKDGTFIVRACRLGNTLLTANAESYVVMTTNIECSADSGPYDLVLKRGCILKMRVVDSAGKPIANARILYTPRASTPRASGPTLRLPQSISPIRSPEPVPQMAFIAPTDQDGRAVWNSAPEGELLFQVSAPGFMMLRDIRCPADGQEHVVTLDSAFVVTGTVIDASTRQPIAAFRLTPGVLATRINFGPGGGETRFMATNWYLSNLKKFKNGQFRRTLEGPLEIGGTNCLFKIEADGYQPFVSRFVGYNEREVRFEVELQAAESAQPAQPVQKKMIHVFQPNGQPADYAEIELVSPGKIPGLMMRGFKLGQETSLHTDQNGWSRFSFDNTSTSVILVHSSGYLETTPAELQSKEVLTLQAWGRLEINCGKIKFNAPSFFMPAGTPSGRDVTAKTPKVNINLDTASGLKPVAYPVEPDDQGKINIPQIPPGRFRISWRPEGHLVQFLRFEVRPGETTTLDLTQVPASAPLQTE